jgi:7,8-dihydroneopterin aldolase/epimerase/oxygenase
MNPPDEIRIASLELRAHVGVPAAERKKAQRLTVFPLTMVPVHEFGAMDDDVARTIDYAAVAKAIRALAAERPRKLIETLAEEIAQLVLDDFAAAVFSSARYRRGAGGGDL